MNLSGLSVGRFWFRSWKITVPSAGRDCDLTTSWTFPLGTLRIRERGSENGHKRSDLGLRRALARRSGLRIRNWGGETLPLGGWHGGEGSGTEYLPLANAQAGACRGWMTYSTRVRSAVEAISSPRGRSAAMNEFQNRAPGGE